MNSLKITLLLILIAQLGSAQEYQSKSELKSEILGTWHYENEPKSTITFSDDGVVKRYFEDKLQSTGTYEITNSCDGEELPDKQFFLKEKDINGSSFCSFIEAVNFRDNGIFTLMTRSQGKVIVFKTNNS